MPPRKGSDKYKVWKKSEKYKIFVENRTEEKNGMFGKRNPIRAKLNRQRTGTKNHMFGRIGEKHPMFGKYLSQAIKDKISKTKTGKKIHKICPICGIGFDIIPSHKHQECCSKKCKGKLYSGENSPQWKEKIQKICLICKKTFKVPLSKKDKKCCSPKCSREMLSERFRREKNPFFNQHHSQKQKDKWSEDRKGKYIGENNPMFGMTGEKCPTYTDGKGYDPYPVGWTRITREIRFRDGYLCQKCGLSEIEEINGQKLSTHHIDNDKRNCLANNLITLCFRCNMEVRKNPKKWKKHFQKKMQRTTYKQEKQLCLARI